VRKEAKGKGKLGNKKGKGKGELVKERRKRK
jgi:hypothetical protein